MRAGPGSHNSVLSIGNVLQHSDSIDLDLDADAHRCVAIAVLVQRLAMRHLDFDAWDFNGDELESFVKSKHFWPEAAEILAKALEQHHAYPISMCPYCERMSWVANDDACAACGASGPIRYCSTCGVTEITAKIEDVVVGTVEVDEGEHDQMIAHYCEAHAPPLRPT